MIKKINLVFFIALFFWQCSSEPTSFSAEALTQVTLDTRSNEKTFATILDDLKGEVVLIDVWASWCGDCLKAIPTINALKKEYGNQITVLYLSMDKTQDDWKKAIEKYELDGVHYFIGREKWSDVFGKSIELNWIPRFMVLDKKGNILLHRAEVADDQRIREALDKGNS